MAAGAGFVYSVAFSRDGHVMASGNSDGTIRLWDVADPAHPRPLGQPLPSAPGRGPVGGTAVVQSVAFSPDGHTLASGDNDGNIQLWDVADPAHPRLLGQARDPAATLPSNRWRSVATGARWPAAATTADSSCGMSPIPRTPARSASA